jgi:hypothetical protein
MAEVRLRNAGRTNVAQMPQPPLRTAMFTLRKTGVKMKK